MAAPESATPAFAARDREHGTKPFLPSYLEKHRQGGTMAWRRELGFTLRRLAKSPGFVMAAVVSVGLGIAANATIFAMVSRFVLKPAAAGNPERLLSLHTTWERGQCCNAFAWPLYADVRDQAQSFSGLAAFHELVP